MEEYTTDCWTRELGHHKRKIRFERDENNMPINEEILEYILPTPKRNYDELINELDNIKKYIGMK